MKKQTKMACVILAFAAILGGCKKSDALKSDSEILSKGNSKLSGGDGKWDLLGYGLDATGDMLDLASVSDAPIIDVEKFDNDYHTRIDLNGTIEGTFGLYVGYSALDYLNDVSNTKSFDGKGDVKIAGTEKGKEKNFSASLKTSSSNQTTNTYSSKYSYATYEAYQRVKRIRFTGDADMQLLMQYLTPEFINNIATKNADDLVKRYGTHVMLDISIGGCLRFNYRGVVSASSSTQEKKTKVSVGLGVSVLGIGVNLSPDKSKEEITKITSETSDKEYTGKYYGGTNSGQSISIDKDGRTTENINFSSWQQSVNDKNAALIDVGRAVFLYDFIADPVKKALVKAAVEKHIKDSQPQELGEVPIYVYNNTSVNDHYFTPDNQPTIGGGAYAREGIAFYAFSKPTTGAVPIYVYNNLSAKDHYFTPDNQPTIGGGAYVREGIAFYAYPSSAAGRIPVFVYNNLSVKDHYWSTVNAPTIGGGGYLREGISFYVPN